MCLTKSACSSRFVSWLSMGLLPTAGAQHTELLFQASPSLVFPRSLGGGGGRAVTQLEIGHYLNSRLLRAEILRWQTKCEAWPAGFTQPLSEGDPCAACEWLGLHRTRATGRAGTGPYPHTRSWCHQELHTQF